MDHKILSLSIFADLISNVVLFYLTMRNEVFYEEARDVVLVAFHTAAAEAPLKS